MVQMALPRQREFQSSREGSRPAWPRKRVGANQGEFKLRVRQSTNDKSFGCRHRDKFEIATDGSGGLAPSQGWPHLRFLGTHSDKAWVPRIPIPRLGHVLLRC